LTWEWELKPKVSRVIVRMAGGAAFTFTPPRDNCGAPITDYVPNAKSYLPGITVFESIANPDFAEAYRSAGDEGRHEVSVLSGEIRLLKKKTADYVESKEDAATNRLLEDPSCPYQFVVAHISPWSRWGTSDEFRTFFRNATSIVLASGGQFNPKWYSTMSGESMSFNLRRAQGAWVFAGSGEQSARFYFRLPPLADQDAPIAVDYYGTRIRVYRLQEIFDPRSQRLIAFVTGTQSFPYPPE